MRGRPRRTGSRCRSSTKADGSKFGKTETGTVWLDPAKTSAYEMYQFWLNSADAEVVSDLRYFTFLPPEEIDELARLRGGAGEARRRSGSWRREVTRIVHGEAGLAEAEATTAEFPGRRGGAERRAAG